MSILVLMCSGRVAGGFEVGPGGGAYIYICIIVTY